MPFLQHLWPVAAILTSASCQNVCPQPLNVIYEQTVSIKTIIESNTTFYPIPQAPITIQNAPTSIDSLFTLRWTSSRSQAATIASTSATPSSTFVLLGKALDVNQKRQVNLYEYITVNGTTTSDCSRAIMHSINNGVLTASINGQTYYYSTSAGVGYQAFVPTVVPGAIVTNFSLQNYQNNQILVWANNAFYNGFAYFCSTSDGTVYAVFAVNAQPSGCFYFQLVLYSSTTCQQIPSIGPTGPTDESPCHYSIID